MTTIPGTQLVPEINWRDALTSKWLAYETPNSDKMRRAFTTDPADKLVIVTVVNGVIKQFPPQTGATNLQNNASKDASGNFPGFFVFKQ
jgi:hypothetical protein